MSEFATTDGDRYHATLTCAPRGADRVLAEFAEAAGMEPCGVCQPDPEPCSLAVCGECGYIAESKGGLNRHRNHTHLRGAMEDEVTADDDPRWRELNDKARGGSE
jgi:hypothetical protein